MTAKQVAAALVVQHAKALRRARFILENARYAFDDADAQLTESLAWYDKLNATYEDKSKLVNSGEENHEHQQLQDQQHALSQQS